MRKTLTDLLNKNKVGLVAEKGGFFVLRRGEDPSRNAEVLKNWGKDPNKPKRTPPKPRPKPRKGKPRKGQSPRRPPPKPKPTAGPAPDELLPRPMPTDSGAAP